MKPTKKCKPTNKELTEQKGERFTVYTFDKSGGRAMSYGNLNIINATNYLLNVSKSYDTLIVEHSLREVKVITELEYGLHRRATKEEIIEFYKKLAE